jgi:hypothetical protein
MMRLTTALLGLAAAGLAAAAAAQDAGQPALTPAQTPAPAPRGLSGLENTVSQLQDNPSPPAAAPAATPAAAPPAHPRTIVPRELQAEQDHGHLEAAVQRGRLLGAIAQAGQIGTQDMLAHVADPNGAGIRGWIALPDANAVTVVFYAAGTGGAPPSSVYRVSIVGGRVTGRQTFLTGNRPPLGPHEARMAAARAATDALDHHPCGSDEFNVFVVPPAAPDAPIDVYQLSPQTQRGHFPLGGHFKSTIARDGSVVASTALAAACADLAVPDGAQAGPLRIADPADMLPTELQVFLAIWTNHPLVVAAGEPPRLFGVTSDGIRPVHD